MDTIHLQGDTDNKLSKGEKERISIARVLHKYEPKEFLVATGVS